MNTQEDYRPVASCMALTVRKEHRLTVIKRATRKTIRISWKTLLYALPILNFCKYYGLVYN